MTERELFQKAYQAKEKAYAPYSRFRVGAALLTVSNRVYTGVNIENASFGATICAERTAVCKAVAEGERKITAIAISSDRDEFIYPCGICRQVLAEFGTPEMKVICGNSKGEFQIYNLEELLPHSFTSFKGSGCKPCPDDESLPPKR